MIDTIGNAELKNKEEDLLKNMKMLRHTVADMLGSKSFLKGLIPEPHNGVITVNGEQFPIYISGNTLSVDSHPDITDDIFDTENYLSLLTDDDLMWYALVEHLETKMENLKKENKELMDEKNQLREELTAADNEINELEESLREANKTCTEHVKEIDKLAIDNKRLSERVKALVIEKTNRPDTAEKVSDADDITSDAITSQSRMETAYTTITLELLSRITELENANKTCGQYIDRTAALLQENANLKEEIQSLKDSLRERISEYDRKLSVFKRQKEEAELIAYRFLRADYENREKE